MTEQAPLLSGLTDEALEALLKRAIRNALILGIVVSLVLAVAAGWRTGALFMTGALVSAASIYEWLRLVRIINARIRKQKAPRGAVLVIGFFLVRVFFFAAAIYVSLKCFQGSPMALVCGLGLAIATLTFEALRLLRD